MLWSGLSGSRLQSAACQKPEDEQYMLGAAGVDSFHSRTISYAA